MRGPGQAVREQGLGEPVRTLVEHRVGELAVALPHGDVVGAPARAPHDVRDP